MTRHLPCVRLILITACLPQAIASAREPPARTTCGARAAELRRLVERALHHAGLARGVSASRRTRLGWSALLPRLTARWSRANGRTADVDAGEPEAGRWYAADRWEVRASWDLSRLVFDARELRIAAAARARARLRNALIERVSALFLERERLRATKASSDTQREALAAALARVRALLDLLTGAKRDAAAR